GVSAWRFGLFPLLRHLLRAILAVQACQQAHDCTENAQRREDYLVFVGFKAIDENAAVITNIKLDSPVIRGQRCHAIIANLMPVIAPIQSFAVGILRAQTRVLVEGVVVCGQSGAVYDPATECAAAFFAYLESPGITRFRWRCESGSLPNNALD